MPLRPGHDRDTISANIHTLRHEGYPADQAAAIAYRAARTDAASSVGAPRHGSSPIPRRRSARRLAEDMAEEAGVPMEAMLHRLARAGRAQAFLAGEETTLARRPSQRPKRPRRADERGVVGGTALAGVALAGVLGAVALAASARARAWVRRVFFAG